MIGLLTCGQLNEIEDYMFKILVTAMHIIYIENFQ